MLRKLIAHVRGQWMGAVALFIVLAGGTAYGLAGKNTVFSDDITNGEVHSSDVANDDTGFAVTGLDVANDSLGGADVDESSLSQVPRAAKANSAFSAFHDSYKDIPASLGSLANPIGSLLVGHAGSYVITATLDARNFTTTSYADIRCVLTAGGDSDTKNLLLDEGFTPAPEALNEYDHESVALQVVHSFDSAASVTLACSDGDVGVGQAGNMKITAVQVNNLTNSGF